MLSHNARFYAFNDDHGAHDFWVGPETTSSSFIHYPQPQPPISPYMLLSPLLPSSSDWLTPHNAMAPGVPSDFLPVPTVQTPEEYSASALVASKTAHIAPYWSNSGLGLFDQATRQDGTSNIFDAAFYRHVASLPKGSLEDTINELFHEVSVYAYGNASGSASPVELDHGMQATALDEIDLGATSNLPRNTPDNHGEPSRGVRSLKRARVDEEDTDASPGKKKRRYIVDFVNPQGKRVPSTFYDNKIKGIYMSEMSKAFRDGLHQCTWMGCVFEPARQGLVVAHFMEDHLGVKPYTCYDADCPAQYVSQRSHDVVRHYSSLHLWEESPRKTKGEMVEIEREEGENQIETNEEVVKKKSEAGVKNSKTARLKKPRQRRARSAQ
ncbi:hypothetical protein C8Q80DRAFT_1202873 [Daedaleopsis nitida]|nr:hypothetical protein C8Q80DRAFT_1202873 [Daedaleopsis nitida]